MKVTLIWILAALILAYINYKFNKKYPDLEDKN